MSKEIDNILEIQSYIETKANVDHRSKPYSVFYADVIYEDPKYGDLLLNNAEVWWQHSVLNKITIPELLPPYYGDFNCRFQDFKYANGSLVITGTHNDDPSVRYRVTLR